jgi:hypothetical protein
MNLSSAGTGRVARPLLNYGFCGRGCLLFLMTGAEHAQARATSACCELPTFVESY